jgi:hypothetical protein
MKLKEDSPGCKGKSNGKDKVNMPSHIHAGQKGKGVR